MQIANRKSQIANEEGGRVAGGTAVGVFHSSDPAYPITLRADFPDGSVVTLNMTRDRAAQLATVLLNARCNVGRRVELAGVAA